MMETLTRVVFPAMGNTVDVTVIGLPHGCDHAQRRLAQLESRWSRFIGSSDISRLNRANGRPTPVHDDTITLVRYLVAAQALTKGVFDPTLAPVLNQLGYSTSRTMSERQCELSEFASAGCDLDRTTIDDCFGAITLPFAATLDPGGLGKGLAADIVTTELMASGATGVCLSIGGDIRCAGAGPINGHWVVDVTDPTGARSSLGQIRLRDGAVATSSLHAKRWSHDGTDHHHVIDPTRQLPVTLGHDTIIQSTVIAAEAVWAEVFATATLVRQRLMTTEELASFVVHADGRTEANDRWSAFAHE